MGYDEVYEIPSEEAVTLSLRTQQIIALESGVTRTVDPLAGSYYVERLTDELEARATAGIADLDDLGGAVAAIEAGIPQRWIAESAYRAEQELASAVRLRRDQRRLPRRAGGRPLDRCLVPAAPASPPPPAGPAPPRPPGRPAHP